MRGLAVPLLLLAAACAGPRLVAVDRQRGLDGAWQVPDSGTALDATGRVVTLRFQGRVLVFEMERFRGLLGEEEAMLRGDGLRVRVTPERVRIEAPPHVVERPLAELPPGRRIVFRAGELVVE